MTGDTPDPTDEDAPAPEPDAPGPDVPGPESDPHADADPQPEAAPEGGPEPAAPRRRPFSVTRVLVAALVGLLGFSFAVQVRSVADDPTVAALGQEDLVRILADLDAHEERLRDEIDDLEETQSRLTTAGESRQEALAEAQRRADELGILAGTLPVEGPGVVVRLLGGPGVITSDTLLNTVQELRSAGAEAMQVEGADHTAVRVIASSYFVDRDGAILVDGALLRGPYTVTVVGEPQTLAPALRIPGGVVASVESDGGTVTVQEEPGGVEIPAVREPAPLEHAQPTS